MTPENVQEIIRTISRNTAEYVARETKYCTDYITTARNQLEALSRQVHKLTTTVERLNALHPPPHTHADETPPRPQS